MLIPFLAKLHARRFYRWHIDIYSGHAVRGWVRNLRDPTASSLVAAYRDGKPVSPVVVTEPRPDLTALGYGPAAFTLPLNEACGAGIDIVVRDAVRGRRRATIERGLRHPPGQGAVEAVSGNRIRGWAACFDPACRDFAIVARRGDVEIARVRPSTRRPDVAAHLAVSNDLLGFEAILPWRVIAFEPVTITGDLGAQRFPIADLTPRHCADGAFVENLRYSSTARFWA